MKIVNGRLEPGRFNFITSSGVSGVDYFITQTKNFTKICNMQVFDISEFSGLCAIEVTLDITFESSEIESKIYDKLNVSLLNALEVKQGAFDNATELIYNDASEADSQIIQLTNLIYDVCFSICGKTVRVNREPAENKRKKAVWFNQKCRESKSMYLNAKRLFRNSASDENKMIFLEARNIQEKRKAKLIFHNSQKSKLAEMGKRCCLREF